MHYENSLLRKSLSHDDYDDQFFHGKSAFLASLLVKIIWVLHILLRPRR